MLHVITCLSHSTPVRRELMCAFLRRMSMLSMTQRVYTTVVHYDENDVPCLPDLNGVCVIRVTPDHKRRIWNKENLLNLAVRHLPSNWRYLAWLDGDVQIMRDDWPDQVLRLLNPHHVVQLFDGAVDLTQGGSFGEQHNGFAYNYNRLGYIPERIGRTVDMSVSNHPGYAWAMTRQLYDYVGGFFEYAIVGGGDKQMALSFLGALNDNFLSQMSEGYRKSLMEWSDRAVKVTRGNMGFLRTGLVHYYHGDKANRGYLDRWALLEQVDFDPTVDLVRDHRGLLEIGRPEVQQAVDTYFTARGD